MDDNKKLGLIYGCFVGDAISLGSHWIYDIKVIDDLYDGIINKYTKPETAPFHKGKKAGDFTHYGEQAFSLLKSIYENKGYDLKVSKKYWTEHIKEEDMYQDHAMKESLEIFESLDKLIGADNKELGGISRSIPIFLAKDIKEEDFLAQVHLTHNSEIIDKAAHYIYRVIKDVLAGKDYKKALEENRKVNGYIDGLFDNISDKEDIIKKADERGQGCPVTQGMPIVLDILFNYSDLLEALSVNIMAGGDNSARAMIIGAILGADKGHSSIPVNLIENLNKYEEINKILKNL